jgi:hypothetical protein
VKKESLIWTHTEFKKRSSSINKEKLLNGMEKFHHVPGFVSVNGVKAVINKNRVGRIVTTTKTIIDGIRAD